MLGSAAKVTPEAWSRMAGDAFGARGDILAAKIQGEAMKDAAAKRSQGGILGAGLSALGTLGGAALVAFCDMRLKECIEPLATATRDDALSEMAYLVKELREHS